MGEKITGREQAELRKARRNMQVVFQDPYGSFDPRQRVERLVAEPLHLLDSKPDAAKRREIVAQALHEVGLQPSDMDKYPHEFSGGQRQRLSIARAIITRPKLVVADEPVSALDVSIRAQILDLLADLNQRLGIAYLFITHDLTVARAITDEVMVMEEGRIVESGSTARGAYASTIGGCPSAGRRRTRSAPRNDAQDAGTGVEFRSELKEPAPFGSGPSRRTGLEVRRSTFFSSSIPDRSSDRPAQNSCAPRSAASARRSCRSCRRPRFPGRA